jgi:hypothetical protein
VVLRKPVVELLTETFAPATAAPVSSRTVPVMEPEVWARIGRVERNKLNNAHSRMDFEIMVYTRVMAAYFCPA